MSVLLWWGSRLSTSLPVYLSLCLFLFCGGGAVCLPVYLSVLLLWWSSLSTCLPVSMSVLLWRRSRLSTCLPVSVSVLLLWWRSSLSTCLPVSVLPLWWRLTMCCVSSLQSSQGGGHRTLLYGHAILLRHYHSSMVRTHSSSSRIPGGQTLNDPILTFQSKPDSKWGH